MIRSNKIAIYKLECSKTGRVYIGKTQNPKTRREQHFSSLKSGKHPVKLMQSDYNKYGEESFDFAVLEIVERKPVEIDLNQTRYTDSLREKELMEQYKSYLPEQGYNYGDANFRNKVYPHKKSAHTNRWVPENRRKDITVENLRNIAEARLTLMSVSKKLKGLWRARFAVKKIDSTISFLNTILFEYRAMLLKDDANSESEKSKETA